MVIHLFTKHLLSLVIITLILAVWKEKIDYFKNFVFWEELFLKPDTCWDTTVENDGLATEKCP